MMSFKGELGMRNLGIAEGDPGELFLGEDVAVGRVGFWVVEGAGDDVDVGGAVGVGVGEGGAAVGTEGTGGGGRGLVGFWRVGGVFEV